MALTDTFIRTAKPRDKPYRKSDGQGLEIEILPSGTKAWRYRYYVDGKQEKVTLGRYPETSLATARQKRSELASLVADGISPAKRKQENKRKQPDLTFEAFSKRYYDEVVCRDRKYPEQMERYLRKDIYPFIGDKLVRAVTVDDVRRIIEHKKAQGFDSSAGQIRDLLKRLYDYAIAAGVTELNPAAMIPRRFVTTERPRTRFLTANEIRSFLTTIYKSNIRRQFKLSFHLLVLTLTRKSELLNARWEHVDHRRGEWHIPLDNSKTGKPHIVYLSRQADALFRELKMLAGRSELVLPGRSSTTKPFAKNALNTALGGLSFDMPPFTIHDLRRTSATHLNEFGFHPDHVEKALNHQITGVRGVYNRAEYADQRREMLQHWADVVDDLVTEHKAILGHFSHSD